MHARIIVLLISLLLAPVPVSSQPRLAKAPVLACIPPDRLACGCSIRLREQSCPNQSFLTQPHLFTELQSDSPLWLHLDGREVSLAHVHHSGTSVKGDPPGPSSDRYKSSELEVKIDYFPAASTCPTTKQDGCEYTDVKTEVTIKTPEGGVFKYKGAGACGC